MVDSLRSNWREFQALHDLGQNIPLMAEILGMRGACVVYVVYVVYIVYIVCMVCVASVLGVLVTTSSWWVFRVW